MTIKQRRLEKGWSQMQLAELAGISLRTVQRIEKGQIPTPETAKSLASVFDVDFRELLQIKSSPGIDEDSLTDTELLELEHVREIQRFVRDLIYFVLTIPVILAVTMIDSLNAEWLWWVLLGWSIYIAWEAYELFDPRDFFGKDWEKKMLEKRLGRKLD